MYLLGCDIGCSSVKVSIVDAETGLPVGTDFYPKEEAPIKIRMGRTESGRLVDLCKEGYSWCIGKVGSEW